MAFGFRTPDGFRNAIYFHLGRLDLYPKGCELRTSNPEKPSR